MRRALGRPTVADVAARAEKLVAEGRDEEALALVERTTAGESLDSRYLLAYTRGWVRQVRATKLGGLERTLMLDDAAAQYSAALELRPGEPQALRNLALIARERGDYARAVEFAFAAAQSDDATASHSARVLIGDLLADPDNPAADEARALESYLAAYRTLRDGAAAERALDSYARLLASAERDATANELTDFCRELAADGRWQLAASGLENAMALAPRHAAVALESWVELEARHGAFAPTTLARLPDTRDDAELTAGRTELAVLLGAPSAISREALPFWTATPRRADVAVAVLCARGSAAAFRDRFEEAAALHEAAFALAAHASEETRIDAALDLALLYHTRFKRLDPERTKLTALVQAPPLDEFAPGSASATGEARERDPREMQQIHTVLGLVWGELGAWRGRAEQHLDEAIGIAVEASGKPAPALSAAIARGSASSADPLDRWIESARGYSELGADERAREQLSAAQAYVDAAGAKVRELEELVQPNRGWYFGLAGGPTFGHTSSAEFENALFEDGHVTDVDLDVDRYGFEGFVGYRFGGPLALQAGYVSLEGPSSQIRELNPVTPGLLADVADEHPLGGKGWTIAVEWTALEWRRWALFARLGAWAWEAEADVRLVASTGRVDIDETGEDLFGGVGCSWRFARRWRALLELERFYIDSEPVDFAALGVAFHL